MDLQTSFMTKLRHMLRKILKPNWWVCEWETKEPMGGYRRQSGRFPIQGGSYAWAHEYALDQFPEIVFGEGDVYFQVRRPTLLERLGSI